MRKPRISRLRGCWPTGGERTDGRSGIIGWAPQLLGRLLDAVTVYSAYPAYSDDPHTSIVLREPVDSTDTLSGCTQPFALTGTVSPVLSMSPAAASAL